MDDLIEEFLAETNESMAELDLDIVNLEQNPNDEELIGKIFRLVHTVKGTCGFLGLPRLEMVAHRGENVLGRFRDKDLEVKPEFVTLILEAFDRIKEIVTGIEETGSEPQGDDTELMAKLDAVYETGELPSDDAPAAEAPTEEATPAENEVFDIDDYEPIRADSYVESTPEPEVAESEAEPVSEPVVEAADKADDMPDFDAVAAKVAEQKAVEEAKKEAAAAPAVKKEAPQVNASLRVNVQVLENLMTMVSELVLTRNQLLQILRTQTDSEFTAPLQRLNQVVSELQEGVMQTRMQPIGNAWGKLPRIIRDLSLDLGKKINLEMRGKETELDRQVLDLIKDPLTHMIRNSGDHGIEMPDERVAAGKREEGTILLNAYHEGGHIIIEISDDGRGLNLQRIKDKALKNGIVSEADLADMSDQQIQQFIFAAGFSTAEQVTSVSGRGVGMDVVRTNIEKIGGTIELKSVEGKGSTFTIKIPLTLAIVSALIVEAAQELYAIPQLSVQELVRASKNSEHRIEKIKGTPVLRLRDRLLPLVSLRDLLQLQDPTVELEEIVEKQVSDIEAAEKEQADNVVNLTEPAEEDYDEDYIVVIQVGSNIVGLIVDRVYDTEEIVVKPVSPILKHIDLFAGNTILGDGSVIMILDPNGITNSMGEIAVSDASELGNDADSNVLAAGGDKKISFLVFDAGEGAPKAVPLSLVSRLEEVAVEDIEVSGDQRVVQYRGKLMPLVPFSNKMTVETSGNQAVLVFTEQDRSMGLMVQDIIDIVEETMEVQLGADQKGLLGSAVINGKAMDVIDVGYFLGAAHSDWYLSKDTAGFDASKTPEGAERRILLVDDSSFFQNMITPLLNVAGYNVHNVSNAQDAVELCQSGKEYDLIISDIEMPGMDGFEFAEFARAENSPWKDVPIVALSAHSAPSDLAKGRSVGFTDYVTKFDRDALLDSIAQTFAEMGE